MQPESRSKPEIQVVVPSYNHAGFIGETLASIFRQTLAPSRLLVIDDGSKDDSVRVIEQALKGCPFPSELLVRKNRGLCATLNQGLASTTGEYFAYLGSDDTWEPRRLEAGAELLARDAAAIAAYGASHIIDGTGARTSLTTSSGHYHGGDMRLAFLSGLSIPKSPTVLYRRPFIERCGWNETSRLEDYETYLWLSGYGPFAYTSEVLGSWRVHGKNVSTDVSFMLERVLDAHRRVGPSLRMGRLELARTRASLRFRYGGFFLETGDRLRAATETFRGAFGAPSPVGLVQRVAKLSTPKIVWQTKWAHALGAGAKFR